MKLYLTHSDTPDGENQDNFIVADSLDEAHSLWAAQTGGSHDEIINTRLILDDVAGTRFEGPARAIPWSELDTVYEN